jgi:hypothetical protein
MSEVVQLEAIDIVKTNQYGSADVGDAFDLKTSTGRPVSWMQACWTGEVIKGLALKFHGDDNRYTVGDWDNRSRDFHRAGIELSKDDLLKYFKCSTTSDFGYGSVRGICLQTRAIAPQEWMAGNITDPWSTFEVADRYFMGIFGTCNRDKFINSLGLYVSLKK